MILVFGSILQSITIEDDPDNVVGSTSFAKLYANSVGGKGALQSLAAAKAGGKTALVGRTGDDELSKHILMRLRKHGVITSGVAKADHAQTGTTTYISNEDRTIIALGASEKTIAEQIPQEVLNDRSVVLTQTELDMTETGAVFEIAKNKAATTILNLSPRIDIESSTLKLVDYLIAPSTAKDALGDLSAYPKLTTIFLNNDGSCELRLKTGASSPIPKISLDHLQWLHPEGSQDAFCGTFAACLYAGLGLDKALIRSLVAATLSASKAGEYDSIPYSDEVNETLKTFQQG